jgi:hypothetical protein
MSRWSNSRSEQRSALSAALSPGCTIMWPDDRGLNEVLIWSCDESAPRRHPPPFFDAGPGMPPFSLLGLSVPATVPERGPGAPSRTSPDFGRDPPARPNRNYLGRNRRRAARRDCNAARLERRSVVDENVKSKSHGKYSLGSAPQVGARLVTASAPPLAPGWQSRPCTAFPDTGKVPDPSDDVRNPGRGKPSNPLAGCLPCGKFSPGAPSFGDLSLTLHREVVAGEFEQALNQIALLWPPVPTLALIGRRRDVSQRGSQIIGASFQGRRRQVPPCMRP